MLKDMKKEDWEEKTEKAILVGYTRFFVGLDPKKQVFTKWEDQLLPLAIQFVNRYTLAKDLIE